jgi:hypothetical protein
MLSLLIPIILTAGEPAVGKAGSPVQVPELNCSSLAARAHPFLFITSAEIEQAKERIRVDRSLGEAYEDLLRQAEKDLATPLEPLDRSWWDEVEDKAWQDTYPIIFEKTWLEPGRMALPMGRMAQAFALSGEERFADRAREILLHLSEFTFEFEHYDVGMNYSVWGHRALSVYDLLFDRFTPEERARLDAFFTRMGRAVLANDIYWIENGIGGGINNHLAWHKMTVGMLGAFYEKENLIDFALHGPRGIGELLERGLVDDGLWCEGSLNYHFTAIVPMTFLADVLRRTGHNDDLFSRTFANGRTLKQPFDAMFGVLFPDGTIPPIGDAYGHWANLAQQTLYEYAYSAYGDPRYAWLLSRAEKRSAEDLFHGLPLREREAPKIGCRLYPEHGYVFLRSKSGEEYWDSDAWCAFLTFDRSGVHSNADKLSLMLFGCGKLLVPDVEARATVPHAFSSKVQKELNRGGLSQNTVMIDGRDQRYSPNMLTLVEHRDLPDEKRATAADLEGNLYPGVRQQRTVCLTEDYVLDVFQVVSNATHELEWILHGPAEATGEWSSLTFDPIPAREEGAWRWIRDLRSTVTEEAWWVEWEREGVRFRVSLDGGQLARVTLCGYPMTDEADCPVFPMLVVAQQGTGARFVALHQAGKNTLKKLDLQVKSEAEGLIPVTVTGPAGSRTHLIPELRLPHPRE